jgi:hypothetical protein
VEKGLPQPKRVNTYTTRSFYLVRPTLVSLTIQMSQCNTGNKDKLLQNWYCVTLSFHKCYILVNRKVNNRLQYIYIPFSIYFLYTPVKVIHLFIMYHEGSFEHFSNVVWSGLCLHVKSNVNPIYSNDKYFGMRKEMDGVSCLI